MSYMAAALSDLSLHDAPVDERLRGLVGLKNLGNTCFFNSVMQILIHTSALRSYFVDRDPPSPPPPSESPDVALSSSSHSSALSAQQYDAVNVSSSSSSAASSSSASSSSSSSSSSSASSSSSSSASSSSSSLLPIAPLSPEGPLSSSLRDFLTRVWTGLKPPPQPQSASSSSATLAMRRPLRSANLRRPSQPADKQRSLGGANSRPLVSAVRELRTPVLDPSPLFSSVCRRIPRFASRKQQDALELLKYLLDGIHEEVKRRHATKAAACALGHQHHHHQQQQQRETSDDASARGDTSPLFFSSIIEQTFGGTLCSSVTCGTCGHVSTVFESFIELSLPLPNECLSRQDKEAMKLHCARTRPRTAWDNTPSRSRPISTVPPLIAHNKAPAAPIATYASKARATSMASKPATVSKTSEQLVAPAKTEADTSLTACLRYFTSPEPLQDYRCSVCSDTSASNSGTSKLTSRIKINPELDLTPFCSVSPADPADNEQKTPRDLSLMTSSATACAHAGTRYRLYGVVVHSGSMVGGHYSAYVRQHRVNPLSDALTHSTAAVTVNGGTECLTRRPTVADVSECSRPSIGATVAVEHSQHASAASEDDRWYYFTDTRVRLTSLAEVLQREAYILFYERV